MIAGDTLVLAACALAAAALIFAIWAYISLKKTMEYSPERGRNNNSQVNADLANLKREFAMLTETVHRFRSQSLAGISENMAEKEQAIKQTLTEELTRELNKELHNELESATDEFDRALSAIVEKIEGRQDELASRMDNLKPNAEPVRDFDTKINTLISASVIDRFLSSLEDPADRRKCLIASLESVQDTVILGKLAVAYPCHNSWLILKELADRGVLSDIAGWALIAGAELTASKGPEFYAFAEELYQAARLSFSTVNNNMVNREGLYVIASGLARLLAHGERAALADMLRQEASAHLVILIDSKPTSMALPAVQLAEFYLNEERFECSSILFRQVIELAALVFPDAIYSGDSAGRLWQGLAHSLEKVVHTSSNSCRDLLKFLGSDTVPFLERALSAKMSLADGDRQSLQIALLRLCEREKNDVATLTVARQLLDDGLTVDSENRERFNFVAGEILTAIDELQLSRKKEGMPVLRRLIGIFIAVNNHSKAASAGAKLVDASLDLYGDASLETVAPINLLADVYKAMTRYDLAEECYRQILEIQYKVYPSEHEEMVDVLLNLAQVCKLQKDVGEAEIFLESAMEMCSHVFDQDKQEEVDEDHQGRRKALLARAEALKGQLSLV